MGQSCDMVAVAFSEVSHGGDVVFGNLVGQIFLGWTGRFLPRYPLDLLKGRQGYLLPHMSYDLIQEKNYWQPVAVCQIYTINGKIESFSHRPGAKSYGAASAVATPTGLHYIPLGRFRGKPSARAAPLYIDYNTRHLSHKSKTYVLLHQRKSGTAGGCHGIDSSQRCSHYSPHAGQFILHLNEFPSCSGQEFRQHLRNFRGRSNRISSEKTDLCRERSVSYSLIPRYYPRFLHSVFPHEHHSRPPHPSRRPQPPRN